MFYILDYVTNEIVLCERKDVLDPSKQRALSVNHLRTVRNISCPFLLLNMPKSSPLDNWQVKICFVCYLKPVTRQMTKNSCSLMAFTASILKWSSLLNIIHGKDLRLTYCQHSLKYCKLSFLSKHDNNFNLSNRIKMTTPIK